MQYRVYVHTFLIRQRPARMAFAIDVSVYGNYRQKRKDYFLNIAGNQSGASAQRHDAVDYPLYLSYNQG